MLVLSRKPGEKILIPSLNTTIQVLEIHGNSVRIGIQAPQEIPIVRAELLGHTAESGHSDNAAQAGRH